MAETIASVIVGLVRLVIAWQLLRLWRQQRLSNLFWLAVMFVINALAPMLRSTAGGWPALAGWGATLAQLCLCLFIHQTFYRERRSPWPFFLAASAAGLIIVTAFTLRALDSEVPLYYILLVDLTSGLIAVLNWSWHALAAYQAYARLATEATLADWIKARYRLMVAYSILMILPILGLIGNSLGPTPQLPLIMLSIVSMLASICLQYAVWAMPESLRRFLNRHYLPLAETLPLSDSHLPQQSQNG